MTTTPENTGHDEEAERDSSDRRGSVSDADHGDTGHPGLAVGPVPAVGRPGEPGARRDGPGGPRADKVLAAMQAFMRNKRPTAGRKTAFHSTGLARAGGDSGNVQARLEF